MSELKDIKSYNLKELKEELTKWVKSPFGQVRYTDGFMWKP